MKTTKYRGAIINEITGNARQTNWYNTYQAAHDAAEKLAKRKEVYANCRIDVKEVTPCRK
jgi:hypothetical protein